MLVKVIRTVSAIGIIPSMNFWNKLIGDNIRNALDKFGKNHVASKHIIVPIPAIIWFSVRLDTKPPNAMYDIASSMNPINTEIVSATFVISPAKQQSIT